VFNVRITLHDYIDRIGNYFLADVTLDFTQTYRLHEWKKLLCRCAGVVAVEGWAYASAEALDPDGTVADTIPSWLHRRTAPWSLPMMVSGRWLQPGDQKAITVSEDILAKFPGLAPGKTIRLKINGHEDKLDGGAASSNSSPSKGRWLTARMNIFPRSPIPPIIPLPTGSSRIIMIRPISS